ncbi:N-acetylmuramoyl-L-alanine amidase [Neobacillus niacini]|uniref:N-acetylmuramoyl-L-alanine amidase n=1 Tax=Neobacillus niacini TaxID=86668 RepID=UPI00300087F4
MVKIMWDPGHDINTPGKGVAGMKEFEFNRAVVRYGDIFLHEYENVQTFFSHDLYDGIDDSLKKRTDRANKLGVDCFCSTHANAASSTAAHGIETFIHPRAGASTVNLGAVVHGEIILLTGLTNRGLKRADFQVLRGTKMDAFLTEGGFMTNTHELTLLKSEDYRKKYGQAIVNGLAQHYKLTKKQVVKKLTDRVVITNTMYWQAKALVQEFETQGFRCYGDPVHGYLPGQLPQKEDGFRFILETDFQSANAVQLELKARGYDKIIWETI